MLRCGRKGLISLEAQLDVEGVARKSRFMAEGL
jgi:hypothetical protein